MEGNFIKINRKIMDWEWYKDPKTKAVFLHLLLLANWKNGRFKGVEIPRGSLASSYPSIAAATGLSIKSVRVALNHLKGTGEVAAKAYHDFSVFSVINYEKYQEEGSQKGRQRAGKGQAKGNDIRKKEKKEEKNNNICDFSSFEQRDYDFAEMEAALIASK